MRRPKTTRPAKFPWFAYIFGVLMIALAATTFFGLPIGYQSFVAQRAADTWPKAQGTVVVSEMLENESDDIESSSTMYQAKVVTEYQVKGRNYHLNEVYVGQSGSWSSDFRSVSRLVKRYRKGSRVTLHYQPDQPWVATLEPGVKPWTYAFLIVDTLFVCMGLFALGYAVKQTFLVVVQYLQRN